MSVHTATAKLDTREPFKSVGLVCVCGKAVAGVEGVIACRHCGAVYSVAVLVLRESRLLPGEAVSPTARAEA